MQIMEAHDLFGNFGTRERLEAMFGGCLPRGVFLFWRIEIREPFRPSGASKARKLLEIIFRWKPHHPIPITCRES